MSKRRRSTASEVRDDEELHTSPTSLNIKRRKKSVNIQDIGEVIQELYDIIRNHKNEEGRLVCEALIRVPKRRSVPEYYEVVSNPIDLLKIQQRIKTEEYDRVDDMVADVELMVHNAQAYYKKTSQEYKDSIELWNVFLQSRREMMEGAVPRGPTHPAAEEHHVAAAGGDLEMGDDAAIEEEGTAAQQGPVEEGGYVVDDPNDPLELLFSAVMGHRDATGRIVSLMFRKLPRRHEFPAYYEIIDHPIDLCDVAIKIKNKKYDRLSDLDKDLALMVKNAKQFNEPGSQIYKDAVTLRKVMVSRKAELERTGKEVHHVIRQRRHSTHSQSAITEALNLAGYTEASSSGGSGSSSSSNSSGSGSSGKQDHHPVSLPPPPLPPPGVPPPPIFARSTSEVPSSTDGDGEEEDDEDFAADSGDPLHVLFDFVLNFRNSLGQLLSEPFMRLPNSRIYPDYYREIKQPLALAKIRSKIKNGKYKSLEELGAELELVFSNAFHYNMPSSQLFKDAEKLHRAMQHKKRELDKLERAEAGAGGAGGGGGDNSSGGAHGHGGGAGAGGGGGVGSGGAVAVGGGGGGGGAGGGGGKEKTPAKEVKEAKEVKTEKKELESEDEGSEKGARRRRSGVPVWKTRRSDVDSTLKAKMMALYHILVQFKDDSGRSPIGLFMEKPSKKEYPDYYHIITEPIDMKTIESNIRNDKYHSEDVLMKDFGLMFDNARHYNEEGSMVYEDANLLETLLKEKYDAGRSTPKSQAQKKTPVKRSPAKTLSPLAQKLNDLFTAIKDYTDQHGRELSPPFIRLPSKNEYPEYYQVIKRPMDMQRIQQKIMSRGYDHLEDMVNDFLLMFDNACKFNEPDSLIYKDALTLQRILLQTKTVLTGDETSGVPDVQGVVREILTSLFVSVANHQDEEGRCYSDSLAEIPPDKDVTPEEACVQKKPMDLDTIRRYLDRGCYRRLDCFQDHIFEVLHRARNLSRTDSQVYEDSIELQKFFIQIRDEICKNGEILLSPALSYTHRHLQNALDQQRREKIPKEMKEDSEKKEEEESKKDQSMEEHQESKAGEKDDENDDGLVVNGVTYRVGDFVYVEPSEKQLKNHIVCIEKLWRDADGEVWLHGNWFLRPNETFHLATRKFLETEVFKSDYYNKVKISQHVLGKCFVMFVKEYFKSKPDGFGEEDVYACESRYSAKAKAFKKIKIWAVPPSSTKILNRDEPLSKVRIASVFAGSPPDKPMDAFGMSQNFQVFDKEREDVLQEMPNDSGLTYYEQVCWGGVWYKLGDAVYLKTIKGRPHICKIDKIWKDVTGEVYILGPVFIHPSETVHPPTRLFYQNEIFLSSVEASYCMGQLLGKCSVMIFKDYISSRPTEFVEKHVYVCESQYKETEQSMRKIKGLRRHNVGNKVIDDELYFFKKPITPLKEPSPLLRQELEEEEEEGSEEEDGSEEEEGSEEKETEDGDMELELTLGDLEDEEEEGMGMMAEVDPQKAEEDALLRRIAEQLGEMDETASVTSSVSATPKSSRSRKKDENKVPRNPSAFILFAGENRAAFKKSNPDMTFGDISRSIGELWRNLPKKEKQKFEEQAAKIAASRPKPEKQPRKRDRERERERERERNRDRDADGGDRDGVPVPSGPPPPTVLLPDGTMGHDPMGIQVYECGWDGCDFMFEDMEDLVTHVVESSGHLRAARENQFSCCWKSCTRFKKNQPFPVYSRLVRHCKEVHMKHAARLVHPHQVSRNYYSRAALHGPNAVRPPTPGSSAVMGVVGPPTPVSMATQQINQSYGGMMQPPYGMARGQAMSPHAGGLSPAYSQGGVPPGQQSMAAQYPPMPPPQPMFVPAPPKTQRLLHSEAYIKYIEGLNNRSDTISDWKHNLMANKKSTPLTDSQKARLPSHWFTQGVLGEEEDLVNALWKMRDIMLNDSLQISKAFQFESPSAPEPPSLPDGI